MSIRGAGLLFENLLEEGNASFQSCQISGFVCCIPGTG